MMTKGKFVCEECYRQHKQDLTAGLALDKSVVEHPDDRFIVNVAIWSEDNQTLLARVPVKRLCRAHALELKRNMRVPAAAQVVQESLL